MSLFRSLRSASGLGALAENPRISAAVLIDTVGAGFLLPLSLVYFTLTSGVPLPQLGLIAFIASIAALPAGLIGGAITDRFGAKVSMIANNAVSAVGYSLFLFVHEPIGIFGALFLTAAAERLYWASWVSYVHRLAAGRSFEQWFSHLEAIKMGALGYGAGVAGLVLAADASAGLRWLVIANIATSVIAAVLFFGQKLPAVAADPPTDRSAHQPAEQSAERSGWADVFRARGALALLLGQFFLGPTAALPNVALSVMFVTIWHLPAAVAPTLFAINTALVALLQIRLTDTMSRIPRAARIWAAVVLVVCCILPLSFIHAPSESIGWGYVIVTGVLLAFADMLYLPPTNAIMVEAPPHRMRGRATSLFQAAFALSVAIYPLSIGLLRSNLPWLLWTGTAVSLLLGAGGYTIAIRQLRGGLRAAFPPEQ